MPEGHLWRVAELLRAGRQQRHDARHQQQEAEYQLPGRIRLQREGQDLCEEEKEREAQAAGATATAAAAAEPDAQDRSEPSAAAVIT